MVVIDMLRCTMLEEFSDGQSLFVVQLAGDYPCSMELCKWLLDQTYSVTTHLRE